MSCSRRLRCWSGSASPPGLGLAGKTVVGFVGSFYAYEGLDLLLDTFPRLLAQRPELRLLLVGGGPQEARLKSQAICLGIADKVGGIASLAAVFAVLTGLVGALSGKALFALLGIGQDATGWMARGFALGTAAHGIGAARALQVHPDAGAWAALALGLQVVVASLLIPLVAGWF